MKQYFLLTMLMMITPVMMAQEVIETRNIRNIAVSDSANTSLGANAKVMVNMEMIRRFQEVKTEGDIYSWSQLIVNRDSRAIHEYMLSYRNSDMNEQSMESIKLALEDKTREIQPLQTNQEEEYYANIVRIKQEINLKLGSENPMALK
jgi:inner membrane protein involved in colicin E2 resistance